MYLLSFYLSTLISTCFEQSKLFFFPKHFHLGVGCYSIWGLFYRSDCHTWNWYPFWPDFRLIGRQSRPVDRSIAGRPAGRRSDRSKPVDRSITDRPVRPVDRPVRSGLTFSDRYRYRSSKTRTGSISVI